ncbi:MAG: hypothetical protein ACYC5O_17690 [Anaerolineae bacterium]
MDVHTHLDAGHLSARGLHDILLYHMVVSDLGSAGCPSQTRLSAQPSDTEAEARLIEALPYLDRIRNTSTFWGVRIILRDLYGWTEPITEANWRRVDASIRERASDPTWPRQILRKAAVRRACAEFACRGDGSADDVLQYSLEWAFFARAQWGINDIPLYELERAWSQPGPTGPLPVTLGSQRSLLARSVGTPDDIRAAMACYVAAIPYGNVISTAQHISTDIGFRQVSDDEMAAALARRQQATPADRDAYASFIHEAFLTELERHGDGIVYQLSLGAEPLPFETGSKLRQETIFELAAMLARHPRLRFQVFLASAHANQALCTLVRELPNLSLAGYWWHNFFPTVIRQVISERLDMIPVSKQIGFFSDAYCVDWVYAKAALVRKQLAEVLAWRVEQGQYTLDGALHIARAMLYESPQELLGMSPSPVLA